MSAMILVLLKGLAVAVSPITMKLYACNFICHELLAAKKIYSMRRNLPLSKLPDCL